MLLLWLGFGFCHYRLNREHPGLVIYKEMGETSCNFFTPFYTLLLWTNGAQEHFFVLFLYLQWVTIFDWLIQTGSHTSSKQKMISLIGVSENYWEINLDADFRMGQSAVGRLWNIIHSQLSCEHARFCVEVFLCAIYKFSFIHSSLYILKLNYFILVYTHQVDWFDFTNNFEEACWCRFFVPYIYS